MKAFIQFQDGGELIFDGKEMKIHSNMVTGELKILDGDRCVFFTTVSLVHFAHIGEPEELKILRGDRP